MFYGWSHLYIRKSVAYDALPAMVAELIKVYVIIELIRVLGNLRVLCLLHEPVMVFRVSVQT